MKFIKGLFFILSLACVLVAAGCDKYTRYKILNVFFTGVPLPEKVPDLSIRKEQKAIKGKEEGAKEIAVSGTHGPYAAKQCFLCHEVTTTVALKKGAEGQRKAAPPVRFDSNLPGRLLAPIKKLCLECHPTKSAQSAFSRNLWIHGPVSNGMCTVCHSPHSTGNSYMLRKSSSKQLCAMCHAEGFISSTEDHLGGKECITCHNSHLGKNRFLLKKDFDEVY